MKNVTKLSCWKELQKIGFIPINYNAFGRKVAIGASLQHTFTDIQGRKVTCDIITIEPSDFRYSRNNYHITGDYITPQQFKLKDSNEFVFATRCNNHYSAK